MAEATWSRLGGEECIRVAGVGPGAQVQIRPSRTVAGAALPGMAGRLVPDGDDVCFVPRFPFIDGTTYAITVDGDPGAVLCRHRRERPATTEVLDIHPASSVVPRNLLRLYLSFSAPMSEGYAAHCVYLVDGAGDPIPAALLVSEYELWDPDRRRVTILLDPARIKQGLLPHRQAGYALATGTSFRVMVDKSFLDASGTPLRAGAERIYRVGRDVRGRVEADRWTLAVPPAGTGQPLAVTFDRPLDHGLVARCLHVVDPHGRPLPGRGQLGAQQRSWRFRPDHPWIPGCHRLVVDPVLEDLAGNSVSRAFDRDLTRSQDEPRAAEAVTVGFHPA